MVAQTTHLSHNLLVEGEEQPNMEVEGVEVIDRPTSSALRKEIQRRFNTTPENHHG